LDGADVKYDGCIDRVPFRPTELLLAGKRKRRKKKMNKRYLPAIAALLIAITCASFLPVIAQEVTLPTYIFAAPTLQVVTIAQDDQLRHTGVMWLADNMKDFLAGTTPDMDVMSQFKILVSYNGVPVTPSSLYCQVVEKDKYNSIKDKQGPWENLETVPKDVSTYFTCKFRWGKPGVGVLDVYYTGPTSGIATAAVRISDYILVVGANYAVGRSTVYGTDMQDICILGWQIESANGVPDYVITKPDGTEHYVYADPLGSFPNVNCEDAALVQKDQLGVPVPWI
jgi:hypothetical protein